MGVNFFDAICVILPAALVGSAVAAFVASKQGVELAEDPIYQERVKKGLVNFSSEEDKGAEPTPEAKRFCHAIFGRRGLHCCYADVQIGYWPYPRL